MLSEQIIRDVVATALREDLSARGDLTAQATIDADDTLAVTMNARDAGVVAGLNLAVETFRQCDPDITIKHFAEDGARIVAGTKLLGIKGNARVILSAERTALNYAGHLSGIASETRKMADLIAHTKAKICCTRKTTPHLRVLEKYAVRCGGGQNHRFGLYDAMMIKDNHIAANKGDIRKTVQRALDAKDHMTKLEVEVDTLEQLEAILDMPFDVVLLDNMRGEALRRAVSMIDGRFLIEASGNITEDTIVPVAEAGVDLISMGRLTQSAPALDIGLDY